MIGGPNRGSEITHQGGVNVQGTHDVMSIKHRIQQQRMSHSQVNNSTKYLSYSSVVKGNNINADMTEDASVARIDPGELIYRKDTTSYLGGNSLNGGLPVLSSLNGLYIRLDDDAQDRIGDLSKRDASSVEKQRQELERSICFLGVSVNGTDPLNDDVALQRSQVTFRARGTVSIQNTSGQNLAPGDRVVWRIPLQNGKQHKKVNERRSVIHSRDGVNHNKITLVLEKFNPQKGPWAGVSASVAHHMIEKYTVGTVLSFSRANDATVDILLTN